MFGLVGRQVYHFSTVEWNEAPVRLISKMGVLDTNARST